VAACGRELPKPAFGRRKSLVLGDGHKKKAKESLEQLDCAGGFWYNDLGALEEWSNNESRQDIG
jgi:hypothetical protein